MKRTSWFPGSVRPVYVGWYERDYDDLIAAELWVGFGWIFRSRGSWHAAGDNRRWRGIAEPAKIVPDDYGYL